MQLAQAFRWGSVKAKNNAVCEGGGDHMRELGKVGELRACRLTQDAAGAGGRAVACARSMMEPVLHVCHWCETNDAALAAQLSLSSSFGERNDSCDHLLKAFFE